MKKNIIRCMAAIALMALSYGCHVNHQEQACSEPQSSQSWQERLKDMMPLLGHRNWIVIADMAYPLQSGQGVVTLYADEPYQEVLKKTVDMVGEAPHVFAHIYHDKELDSITEELVPGIGNLRKEIGGICGAEASSRMHEDLIRSLDEAGKLYTVVIIKTPMTVPYTTTFLELDCAYWGPEKQAKLDAVMGK